MNIYITIQVLLKEDVCVLAVSVLLLVDNVVKVHQLQALLILLALADLKIVVVVVVISVLVTTHLI